jgi:hypothetical protein
MMGTLKDISKITLAICGPTIFGDLIQTNTITTGSADG